MILSYIDILGDGKRHNIKATITTEHPNSSYGQPVLLLGDGKPLNAESWFLMAYQVVKATPEEFELLKKWVSLLALLLEVDDSTAARSLGSKGGKANTPAQNAARAANAKHAGRKPGSKNKPKDKGAA